MYTYPPKDIQISSPNVAGSVLNGFLAALPTVRYRIYGWSVHVDKDTTGIVDVLLIRSTSGVPFGQALGLSVAGKPGETNFLPYPGIPTDLADGVDMVSNSSIATGNVLAILYYYIENVT